MPDPSQFSTDRSNPGRWTITFNNPPINMFVPTTIVELGALMTDLEADPSVKVVVFQSANPDFFIAHLDVSKAAERPEMLKRCRHDSSPRVRPARSRTTAPPIVRVYRPASWSRAVEERRTRGGPLPSSCP